MAGTNEKAIFIHFASHGLDVLVGDPSQPRHLPIEWPGDSQAWIETVDHAAQQLAELVSEHGWQRRPAVVYYRSPLLACQLTSLASASRHQAKSAATLAQLGAVAYGSNEAVVDAGYVGRDRSGEQRKWHFITAVDHTNHARAIAQMVSRAGLTLQAMLPHEAMVIEQLVTTALRHEQQAQGWLHVGHDRSLFVVVREGCLELFRQIDVGMDHVAEALTRPLRTSPEAEPIELSLDEARSILERFGRPDRHQIIDESRQIHGEHLLPLIQPTLQRLIIELKQTVRFSIEESNLSSLILSGPGSTRLGLEQLLKDAMDWQVRLEVQPGQSDQNNVTDSTPACAFSSRRSDAVVNLIPSEIRNRQLSRRFQRGLWAGLAAALLIIAADTYRLEQALTRSQQTATEVQHQHGQAKSLNERRQQLISTVGQIDQLHRQISDQVDFSVDWPAMLLELSHQRPPQIELLSISGMALSSARPDESQNDAAGTIEIDGYLIGEDADDELTRFLETIRQSPLVSAVELGRVKRTTVDGRPAKRFALTIAARPIPRITETLFAARDGDAGP